MGALVKPGGGSAPSYSADINAFLASANNAAAREAIGAVPHYIGQETTNMLPLSLTGGVWIDSRGWKWLPPTGQSIGSASSGATVATADVEQIYLALWPHLGLSTPGYSISGGVGASAAADWVANKALTIPDLRGRTRLQVGQGSGLSNRPLGQILGEERVTLTIGEMPNHEHGHDLDLGDATMIHSSTGGTIPGGSSSTIDSAGGFAVQSTGGGDSHNNMQPSAVVNILWFTGAKA